MLTEFLYITGKQGHWYSRGIPVFNSKPDCFSSFIQTDAWSISLPRPREQLESSNRTRAEDIWERAQGCFDKASALSLMRKERHVWKDLSILHSFHFLGVSTACPRWIYHGQKHKVSGLSPSFALTKQHRQTVCGDQAVWYLVAQGKTGLGVTSKNQTCRTPQQSTRLPVILKKEGLGLQEVIPSVFEIQ